MNYGPFTAVVFGFICSLPACLVCQPATAQTKALVDGNTAFACDLYARLKGTPGNLFFSPYSVSSCLAMAYAGARGNTETQMGRVLHFGGGQNQVHSQFADLRSQLKQGELQKGVELNIANALWTQQGYPFLPAFLQIAQQQYGAEVNQADFTTGADNARITINQWIAEQTKNRIRDLLAPGTLNALSRLVLANAIYFKGAWAVPFAKSSTRPLPFHSSTITQSEASFMYQTEPANYFESDTLQALELPYSGKELSMVVLLPRKIDGCGELEKSLTPTTLGQWLDQLAARPKVEIFLPRFKLESAFSLEHLLPAMGMGDAFSNAADFSGIDGSRDLYISAVVHKAWVEVNEEGTEAAAATGAVMALSAFKTHPPTPVFRADHPFVFLIRDNALGSVLFLGRLSEPKG